jgi:hypothetical protein
MPFQRHPLMQRVRETPLERCPNLACRRAGTCRAPDPVWQCRKYVYEINEWRLHLARKIERLYREWERDHPEEARALRGKPLPDWSTEALPAIREAMAEVKAERARLAGQAALQAAETAPAAAPSAPATTRRPRN